MAFREVWIALQRPLLGFFEIGDVLQVDCVTGTLANLFEALKTDLGVLHITLYIKNTGP